VAGTAAVARTPAAATAAPSFTPSAVASTFTRWFGPRFIYVQNAPVQFGPIQVCDGCLGFTRIAHFQKGETARLSGLAISHNIASFNPAVLGEGGLELILCCSITEIAHKNIGHSVIPFLQVQIVFDGLRLNQLDRWKRSSRKQTKR